MINANKYLHTLAVFSLGVLVAYSCLAANQARAADNGKSWSYQGDTGPENWGKLSKDYYACAEGKNQSPVNIANTVDGKLPAIPYNYNMLVADRIINNGHTIQVDIRSGGIIEVDKKEFKLKQFHFHTPSENMIKGKSYPLEVHFVHQSEDGQLAVIAIMYTPGPHDPLLGQLLSVLPYEKGQSSPLGVKDLEVLETDKELKHYIRFNGSLTTPPCTEGVIWIVKKPYSKVSDYQLSFLRKAIKHPNNRPVQPINARVIID